MDETLRNCQSDVLRTLVVTPSLVDLIYPYCHLLFVSRGLLIYQGPDYTTTVPTKDIHVHIHFFLVREKEICRVGFFIRGWSIVETTSIWGCYWKL